MVEIDVKEATRKKLVRQTGYLLYKCVRIRDGLVFWCLNLFLLLFTSKINFVYIIKLLREILKKKLEVPSS